MLVAYGRDSVLLGGVVTLCTRDFLDVIFIIIII